MAKASKAANKDKREQLVVEEDEEVGVDPKGFRATWKEWPKTVFCIVGNEFCERFSYYGMRTILTLYALNWLGYNGNQSTVLFHVFTVFAYTTPLFGSILADGYIGKFHTILWISLLYAAGQVLLSVAASFASDSKVHPALDLTSLAIIAIGTGGIKPCVAAFGADQFKLGQERLISIFFSVFYFSINAGSTISTFLTPILRTQNCQGNDTCYPLAFGVPAVLMVVATVLFVIGSFWYKKKPVKENIIFEVVRAIFRALRNKRHFHEKKAHWMDHYMDNHDCDLDNRCKQLRKCHKKQFVDDIKAVFCVIIMYVPVPMFWALFDQQGSRWILQGIAMDSRLWKGVTLLPDQMTTLNAVFIMIFIPIFQFGVYPLVKKCGIEPTPLRRMAAGGFLAALAFCISALVQFSVNKTLPDIPSAHQAHLSFVNSLPCQVTFQNAQLKQNVTLNQFTSSATPLKIDIKGSSLETVWNVSSTTDGCITNPQLAKPLEMKLEAGKANYTAVSNYGWGFFDSNLEKPTEGEGQFKLKLDVFFQNESYHNRTLYLCRKYEDCECYPKYDDEFKPVTVLNHSTEYVDLKPGIWKVWLPPEGQKYQHVHTCLSHLIYHNATFNKEGQGGIFTMTITGQFNESNSNWTTNVLILVPDNKVSILWQIPQYIVITAGEILFSITGLEFSYSQAPVSMKSVIQAIWLFTVALGDVIVVVVVESIHIENLAYEMLLFAGVMVFVMIIFVLLSIFYYKYTFYTRAKEAQEEDTQKSQSEDETQEEM